MDALYTAEALATGAGRDGRVATGDGRLELDLAIPKEMGGSGDGANPEQLFAAATPHASTCAPERGPHAEGQDHRLVRRSACADRLERRGRIRPCRAARVVIPDLPHDQAQALADAAHQVCPYSNATRGNIDVAITVSDD